MSLLYVYPVMIILCRLLAPLCLCQWCSECDETLFLVTGTTDFVIQHCPMCYYCSSIFLEIVKWHDEHGHTGKVARNYMVNTLILYTLFGHGP